MAKNKASNIKKKLEGFSSIEDFDFSRTPTKVTDELLDREDKIVKKSAEEIEANEVENPEAIEAIEPPEEESEIIDVVDEGFVNAGEFDDDGDGYDPSLNGDGVGAVGSINEEMAEQIIPSINEGLKLLGTLSYDHFVKLNDETQNHLEFLEKKMREGKGLSPIEGQTFAAISAITKAMTDARTLYMNQTLPMTENEKALAKRALIAYWKSIGKEFSSSSLLAANGFMMAFKRIVPIATNSLNFGKATV